MRYAELEGNRVRFVLPSELSELYMVLPPGCIEISLSSTVKQGDIYEYGEFRKLTHEEIQDQTRPVFNDQRDSLFKASEWVRQRHADRVELEIDDSENWTDWLTYWQTLRDMPEQPDFDASDPQWPEQPE